MFNNQGTLRKAAIGNNGTSRFSGVALNNTGSVEVQAGTLVLGGGGTHSGATFAAIAPGALDFGGGLHRLDATCSVAGSGTSVFGGGTTAHLGSYAVSGTTRVAGGDVIFSGPVSALGGLEINSGTADFSSSAPQISLGSLAQAGGTLSGSNTLVVGGAGELDVGDDERRRHDGADGGPGVGRHEQDAQPAHAGAERRHGVDERQRQLHQHAQRRDVHQPGYLELSNDGGLTNNQGFFDGGSGSGAFNNHGTLRKLDTGNSGTSRFSGVAVTNTGVVEVQAGA